MKVDQLFEKLSSAFNRKRLGHGIFIYGGPEHQWRKDPSFLNFVKHLLCEQQSKTFCGQCESCKTLIQNEFVSENNGIHPDLIIFQPESQTKGYTMEQVSEILKLWQLRKALSPCKLLWVQQAHHLSSGSQGPANTLLKTLEEPRPDCFLLLSSEKPDAVLGTLKSRCQNYFLSPQGNVSHSQNSDFDQSLWQDFFQWFNSGQGSPRTPADADSFWKDRDSALTQIRSLQWAMMEHLKLQNTQPRVEQVELLHQIEDLHRRLSFYTNPGLQWSDLRRRARMGL